MIQFNNINNFKAIFYNNQDIKTVYDYQGEVWTKTFKFKASYSDGKSLNLACNGNTTLTKRETHPSGYVASAMTSAEIGNCVTQLSEPSAYNKGIFQNCTSLTSVTIADSVTLVYDYTFYNCTSLTSVTIPSGVTSIGENAFGNCRSLTSANIPSGVTSISDGAFRNCGLTSVTIPNSVTSIGESAFGNCSGMTSVTFEEGTQPLVISGTTFRQCTSLMELNIPDRVTTINATNVSGDERAFYGCTSLTSLTIGSGITYIGKEAFWMCSGLTSITVNATTPPTLKQSTFERWPFDFTNNCPIYVPCESVDAYKAAAGWRTYASRIQCMPKFKLTLSDSSVVSAQCDSTNQISHSEVSAYTGSVVSAEIGQCVTSIGYGAFINCRSLTSITIPTSVTIIDRSAFFNCSGLTSVTIPSGVTTIEAEVFYHCSGLTSITIPSGVTSIGNYAFNNCTSLSSVTIPSGVTSIGNYAFRNCTSLSSVTCNATTPPTLGNYVFDNTNNCPIYVPAESVDTYKVADFWMDYADRIQAMP